MVQNKRMIQRDFFALIRFPKTDFYMKSEWGFSQLLWAVRNAWTTGRSIKALKRYDKEYEAWKAITK
jgi:hypothetical protein